jgi:hypothetical protein
MSQAPIISLPNLHNPFKVEMNAREYAMGAILMQGGKLVCYHYEMFHGGVLKYPTHY